MRRATMIGIPVPSHRDAPRASGRYAIKAPDAPIGSVLRVTMRDGTVSCVELVGVNLFVGLDGEFVDFCDWDYATRAEVDVFRFRQHVGRCADEADLRGALAFAATIQWMPPSEKDVLLVAVAEELTKRGKPGKAEQVLVCRMKL